MNSSSRAFIFFVGGVTALAATAGVVMGVMHSRSQQSIATNQTSTPTATVSHSPAIAIANVAEPAASELKTPPSEVKAEKRLQREVCTRANGAIIADPNPPINVRSSPRVASNNIVGQVQNGTFVNVTDERNGWFQIENPVRGWIAKNRTRSSCTQMRVRITFPSGRNSETVRDRIVGGGTHSYVLRATRGQRMTVTKPNNNNPFPTIIAPDDRVLAGDPYSDRNRTQWTRQLPLTGNYKLEFESNGAGYEYGFTVQVR